MPCAKHWPIVCAVMLMALLGVLPANAQEIEKAQQKKLVSEFIQRTTAAQTAYKRGEYAHALENYQESLKLLKKLFTDPKFSEGQRHIAIAEGNVAMVLVQMGQPDRALAHSEQALSIFQRLYPKDKHPRGHAEIAEALANLGQVFLGLGDNVKARPRFEQGLAMLRQLYPRTDFTDGHEDIAAALLNLATVLEGPAIAQSIEMNHEAVAMFQKLYPQSTHPNGHPALATGLNNLGTALDHADQKEEALRYSAAALAMRRSLFPPAQFPNGHPDVAVSLNNNCQLWVSIGALERAIKGYDELFEMLNKQFPKNRFPNGHPYLASAHDNYAEVLAQSGLQEKSLLHLENALEMRRQLYPRERYPNGHPELAWSLAHVASAWAVLGSWDKSLALFEASLAAANKLYPPDKYPEGSGYILKPLLGIAGAWVKMDKPERALPYCDEAVAHAHKLYPTAKFPGGHDNLGDALAWQATTYQAVGRLDQAVPIFERILVMRRDLDRASSDVFSRQAIAGALNNLAGAHMQRNEWSKAIALLRESLDVLHALYPEAKYPNGHVYLAGAIANYAAALQFNGETDKALPLVQQSLVMFKKLGDQHLALSSEASSVAFFQALASPRDEFLTMTIDRPQLEAEVFREVLASKNAVTRALEYRRLTTRLSGHANEQKIVRLREIGRRTGQLLQDTRLKIDDRDRLLRSYADERDRLERELAQELPILANWSKANDVEPDQLARTLPAATAYVDFVGYSRITLDRTKKGKAAETRTPSYTAFVVAPGQPIRRVELGDAKPIDDAIRVWRSAIDTGTDVRGVARADSPPSERAAAGASATLRTRIWEPLAKLIPATTQTLYLSPDGDLSRLPWAALPIADDQVLLEKFAVATVPHGRFLLEQLKHPFRYAGPEAVLALGGVKYKDWDALPGTRTEVNALTAVAPTKPTVLANADATAAKLTEALPKVRFAHLATHGEFKATELAAEKKRELEARERWQEGMGQEVRRVAARNPLGFVGLVLANDEVITGLSLLDLPLENLKLVTLSACETGLGEYTGGKGVENLQQAFHVAGCPNVIASLWKVSDAATAALMAKFYHEMWVNKQPPIDALRIAQLTIYRSDSEQIAMLAGLRGKPNQDKTVELKPEGAANAKRKQTMPTKLWAAFVLSGVGQ